MERRFYFFLALIWMIIVGSLLITPAGIFSILCDATVDVSGFIGETTDFVIGIISISAGIIGLVALKKKKGGTIREFFSL